MKILFTTYHRLNAVHGAEDDGNGPVQNRNQVIASTANQYTLRRQNAVYEDWLVGQQ